MELALFVTGGLWVLAARTAADHAARGLALRFSLGEYVQSLMVAAFLLFLLLVGFQAIHWIATRSATLRSINALPARSTRWHEWRLGAALGWALLVAAVIPMFLAGDLLPTFWFRPRLLGLSIMSLLTLLLFTLALEVAFRGYLYERLIRAIGPTAATVFLASVYAWNSAYPWNSVYHHRANWLSVWIALLLGLLFSLAYLRTRALWLGWGLHFAWAASMVVLFGLPLSGSDIYPSVVDTSVQGADWLTGGLYGPEGAVLTLAVLAGGLVILYRLTRGTSPGNYTYTPIVAAGLCDGCGAAGGTHGHGSRCEPRSLRRWFRFWGRRRPRVLVYAGDRGASEAKRGRRTPQLRWCRTMRAKSDAADAKVARSCAKAIVAKLCAALCALRVRFCLRIVDERRRLLLAIPALVLREIFMGLRTMRLLAAVAILAAALRRPVHRSSSSA